MEVLGFVAAVFIGIVLGLLGGGGSILSIPILVYLFGVNPVTASAYSLFIVGITSLVGAIPKYREHLVNIRTGILFGLPSIASIFLTRKWFVPMIPDIILQTDHFVVTKRLVILGTFSLLMILASVSLIRQREIRNDDQHVRLVLIVVEGIVIGFLTGLVGAGGGFLIIPALVLLTGLPFKTAVGTSLFIISINSLMGFLGDVLNYSMDWNFLAIITSLAVVGILIGHSIQRRIPSAKLRRAFGWLILLMGLYMLSHEIIVHASGEI